MIPAVSRRVVYPLQERLLSRPTFPYLSELEDSQWLPRAELEVLQGRKLRRLLDVALKHSPWHAKRICEAGIDPRDAEACALEVLGRLPTMCKADAAAHRDELVWHGVPGGAYPYNTGGSSGEPLVFHFGRWRQASDAAGRMRARRWWGVDVGEPEVYLWGAPVELTKAGLVSTIRDRLINQLVLNAFEMSPANMDTYVQAIREYRPRCVYGYASSLALLAAHARDRGENLMIPELKVVCTTGEPLYPNQRSLLEDVFGVPAANEFGSRDIGFTAHESPEGQILLMSESIVLEVLDKEGNSVGPGAMGEAVMTGLCSEAQPFIRYRTGDLVRLSAEGCRAGRGLHVLDEVAGRTTDFVTRADGSIMHALAVIYVIRAVDGIGEFKFVQRAVDDLEVLVVPGARWNEEAVRDAVTRGLKQRLGENIRVDVRVVEGIEPERSGKHRYVISQVPLPDTLQVATGNETVQEQGPVT